MRLLADQLALMHTVYLFVLELLRPLYLGPGHPYFLNDPMCSPFYVLKLLLGIL